MSLIDDIREKFDRGEFEFSEHSVDQSLLRRISVDDIRECVANGEIIEDYPDDKFGPTCLILGWTASGRPLPLQCSHPTRPLIVTAYEPDPNRWQDFRQRRRKRWTR